MPPFIHFNKIFVQHILQTGNIIVDVVRFDEMHQVVSGNKWFKLQYYLQDAVNNGFKHIVTFGGAYSNHIVATAFVCKELRLKCTGIIRGEEPAHLSHTLIEAKGLGMDLIFVSRGEYRNKQKMMQQPGNTGMYFINEGGYGLLGAKGAAEMMNWIDGSYTHVLAATGTGTMLAGLIKAAKPHQQIIGINVMKGNENLINEINSLLTGEEQQKNYLLLNDYHFGGYAKHPAELLQFMNHLWQYYQLPTDFVYNSKTLFATFDLISKNYFPPGSKIMAVQCGGLQGNRSLPVNILAF
jgi:1-aminocyclopropane-1-carboxylate deaminase